MDFDNLAIQNEINIIAFVVHLDKQVFSNKKHILIRILFNLCEAVDFVLLESLILLATYISNAEINPKTLKRCKRQMAGCPGLQSGSGRCTGCHNGSGGTMGPRGCQGCSKGRRWQPPATVERKTITWYQRPIWGKPASSTWTKGSWPKQYVWENPAPVWRTTPVWKPTSKWENQAPNWKPAPVWKPAPTWIKPAPIIWKPSSWKPRSWKHTPNWGLQIIDGYFT